MLNDKTNNKKKKSQAIDPYLKHMYFDGDNGDEKILNYQDEERFEPYNYPEYGIDRLRNKRQIDITPLQEGQRKYESYLTPLYAITAVFGAVLIVGPFLVKKGPNRGIVQACIMLSAFCMWIFWFTIYFGQMNPLMGPRLENTTVAWIAYKLGNPVPAPPPEVIPEPEESPPGPPNPPSPPDEGPQAPPEEPLPAPPPPPPEE